VEGAVAAGPAGPAVAAKYVRRAAAVAADAAVDGAVAAGPASPAAGARPVAGVQAAVAAVAAVAGAQRDVASKALLDLTP